ncbi:hypothetical protein [Streptomyces sp. NPDC005322]|uniref:hypothetical protein n=1 Tax=unclassified Streptomyces TaxID=2593676 RepID=UPI0033B9DB04
MTEEDLQSPSPAPLTGEGHGHRLPPRQVVVDLLLDERGYRDVPVLTLRPVLERYEDRAAVIAASFGADLPTDPDETGPSALGGEGQGLARALAVRHPSPDPSPGPCSKPCTTTSRSSKTFITNPLFPANVDPASPAAPRAIESARPSSLDALTPSALAGT